MDIKDILKKLDHTMLSVTGGEKDIEKLIAESAEFEVASVCVPPCYVALARRLSAQKVPVCTVIGFPNGYSTTKTKVFEALDSIDSGASEIDMVINVGYAFNRDYKKVQREIREIRKATDKKVLKVIIETSLLDAETKKELTAIVRDEGADFIKTSTGFSGGATEKDIEIFKSVGGIKIKASGGIRTVKDAEKFILLGADRIGASSVIKDYLSTK